MAICGNCSKSLNIFNSPLFGGGLASGEKICHNCYSLLITVGLNAWEIKKLTLEQVKERLGDSFSIEAQLKNLGVSIGFPNPYTEEIKALPSVISRGEKIIGFIGATYKEASGALVATDTRLFFIDKEQGVLLSNVRIVDFGLDSISSIQYEFRGLSSACIKIISAAEVAEFDVKKTFVQAFCNNVRAKISERKQPVIPQVVVQQQLDVADQLVKLANLKEQGILSQDEFDTQKKKLLSS